MKDVPVWATLAVAGLVLIGSLYTAWQSKRAAKFSAEVAAKASWFGVSSDRFADWQMYKRKVYAELISAVRAVQVGRTPASVALMEDRFDVAFLAAKKKELQDLLGELDGCMQGSEPGINDVEFRTKISAIIAEMREDGV